MLYTPFWRRWLSTLVHDSPQSRRPLILPKIFCSPVDLGVQISVASRCTFKGKQMRKVWHVFKNYQDQVGYSRGAFSSIKVLSNLYPLFYGSKFELCRPTLWCLRKIGSSFSSFALTLYFGIGCFLLNMRHFSFQTSKVSESSRGMFVSILQPLSSTRCILASI